MGNAATRRLNRREVAAALRDVTGLPSIMPMRFLATEPWRVLTPALKDCRTPSRGGGNLFSSESPLVMLGLWSRPGRLIAVRRGNPLHFGFTDGGTYLPSLPHEMPGEVKAVRNNTVQEFGCGKRVKSLAI